MPSLAMNCDPLRGRTASLASRRKQQYTAENVNKLKTNFHLLFGMGVKLGSLKVRGKHRFQVFENRVLRGIIYILERGETGGWRNLHSEELHNLYFSLATVRMINSRSM
jgi:hypothetical protein